MATVCFRSQGRAALGRDHYLVARGSCRWPVTRAGASSCHWLDRQRRAASELQRPSAWRTDECPVPVAAAARPPSLSDSTQSRLCENSSCSTFCETSTSQNGAGSIVLTSRRVERPPTLLRSRVFTRPQSVTDVQSATSSVRSWPGPPTHTPRDIGSKGSHCRPSAARP